MGDHSNQRKDRYVTPMDVQERTLKVTNYGRSVTEPILRELFSQGGPVRKIVFKEQFSYVEFEDAESVAYCLALFDGVELFGDRLVLAPKIGHQAVYQYYNLLKQYERQFTTNPMQWWNKFGDPNKPCPSHICAYTAFQPPATNYDLYNPMQGNHRNGSRQMPPQMSPQMPPQRAYQHPMNQRPPSYPPQMMSPQQLNHMRQIQANQQMQQMPSTSHQLGQTRSEFDLRAERRSVNDRAWTRGDRNNNNEQKLGKVIHKYDSEQRRSQQGKRPFPDSPPANYKRIRKHQSF